MAGALSSVLAIALGAAQGPTSGHTTRRHAAVRTAAADQFEASDVSGIAARWGIAIKSLRLASGGYMLELRYTVLDATKAQPLFNRKLKASLRDEKSGLETLVPDPPTTGALRSSNDAKVGRTYFMFFANAGRFVAIGNTATVTIGSFVVTGIPVTGEPAGEEAR